ncbi:MAG: hypothetical protein BECKG1743D_GA0114223_106146 [Candidatus Kentron sp. G]|nr:MAG: hypothetical protein BECKG1743D_GA0114223_106146 [Candidatus Kentron sp. G]
MGGEKRAQKTRNGRIVVRRNTKKILSFFFLLCVCAPLRLSILCAVFGKRGLNRLRRTDAERRKRSLASLPGWLWTRDPSYPAEPSDHISVNLFTMADSHGKDQAFLFPDLTDYPVTPHSVAPKPRRAGKRLTENAGIRAPGDSLLHVIKDTPRRRSIHATKLL